jgi:hypothetical protein
MKWPLPQLVKGKLASDIIFDIETRPLPEDRLLALVPPFDPENVKTGNTKDPQKIAEKIEEARANHTTKFLAKAAVEPRMSHMMSFGWVLKDGGDPQLCIAETLEEEEELIEYVAHILALWHQSDHLSVGFNSKSFDLPFIIKRFWIQGYHKPTGLLQHYKGRLFWHERQRDLAEIWALPRGQNTFDSVLPNDLNNILLSVLGTTKLGTGKRWHLDYFENREHAINYATDELNQLRHLAHALT